MRVLGYDFELIDEESLNELLSLEREGAIYTDHWIERLQDSRHVRIAFTDSEIKEYARSLWAYDLFLKSGAPLYATDVPGIPRDIAERADAYLPFEGNTEVLEDPSYHCIAAFLGEELESLVCWPDDSRRVILEEQGTSALITTIKRAVDSITPAIRRFNRREKGLTPWPVKREDDVRDLLYAMLRASVADIRTEEPVPSKAGLFRYIDIFSRSSRLFIEIKWIGVSGKWKQILKQINDDIQSYITHPECKTLVFIIIDAVKDIPDPILVERELSDTQTISGKNVEILVFVREP